MTDPVTDPVTVAGPPVSTGVMFTPAACVRLRLDPWDDVVELEPDLAAALFAAGLETPTRDLGDRVVIGEIEVDDSVEFLVGATAIDHDTAGWAVARGVERAVEHYVASWRRHPPTTPAPPSPTSGGVE